MSNDISEAMGGDFDPNSVPAPDGFDAIPAGWYMFEITAAVMKDTKSKNGRYLHLEHTILGEQFNGRKVFKNINLVNPNAMAVEIGRRELGGLGQALGLAAITDSSELLGGQVMGKLKVRQEEGRDPDNEITAYKPLDGAAPAAATKPAPAASAAKPPATAAPSAPAKSGKRPWER